MTVMTMQMIVRVVTYKECLGVVGGSDVCEDILQ